MDIHLQRHLTKARQRRAARTRSKRCLMLMKQKFRFVPHINNALFVVIFGDGQLQAGEDQMQPILFQKESAGSLKYSLAHFVTVL